MQEERFRTSGIIRQLAFPFAQERVWSERVGIGTPAHEVLTEIIRFHPQIEKVSYVIYDASNIHDYENVDDLQWIERDSLTVEKLREVPLTPAKWRQDLWEVMKDFEDFGQYPHIWALGVGSLVQTLDGVQAHIPMLDFCCDKAPENLTHIIELTKPYGGFILNSGNSYHFWGSTLLSQEEYRRFLDHFASREIFLKDLVDGNYLDMSASLNFSVLRIFAYPPQKPQEPQVVAVL
ncbi:hypothetical protein HYV21_01800 [Candidatus Microgenomates bacterium]|nr:hypothetical protein [Candidatus Microgenomates bacterium]